MPTRTSAFRPRTFLRERLAPQVIWWKRCKDYAALLSAFSPEMDSPPDFVVILTVVQDFGIKCGATQFHSGPNDRGGDLSLLKSIHFNPFLCRLVDRFVFRVRLWSRLPIARHQREHQNGG
jgi:hypothetical protein